MSKLNETMDQKNSEANISAVNDNLNSKTALDHALAFAKNNYPVFPCNSKKIPLTPKGFKDATTCEKKIKEWWLKHPKALIGIPTGRQSGLVVLDVDKKNGKNGFKSLKSYGELGNTWEVSTPSGGRHYIFKYDASQNIQSSIGTLGEGLDVKSDGGYIIAEGSVIPDVGEYKTIKKLKLANAPIWLNTKHSSDSFSKLLEELTNKLENTKLGERNKELNLAAYKLGEIAKNDECYKEQAQKKLKAACINNGLVKEDGADSVEKTFLSGFNAGFKSQINSRNILSVTENLEANELDFNDLLSLTPIPWIYKNVYLRGVITATVGEAGTGKSGLTLVEALEIVFAKDLIGYDPIADIEKAKDLDKQPPLNVWVLNLEDQNIMLKRRVAGAMDYYNLNQEDMLGKLFLGLKQECDLKIVTSGKYGSKVNDQVILALKNEITKKKIDLLILDPFVSLHNGNENDNGLIDDVIKALGKIAKETDCAIHVVHHTGKSNNGGGSNIGRGASAFGGAVRLLRYIEKHRNSSSNNFKNGIKTSLAKSNYSSTLDSEKYLEIVQVDIGENRDTVGVVTTDTCPAARSYSSFLIPESNENFDKLVEQMKAEPDSTVFRKNHQSKQNYVGNFVVKANLNCTEQLDVKKHRRAIDKFIEAAISKKILKETNLKGKPTVEIFEIKIETEDMKERFLANREKRKLNH